MKKLLLTLLALLCLALPALADSPPGFDESILALPPAELADHMESVLTATDLSGTEICADAQGQPVIVLDKYSAYAAALRRDGLMTLCCFRPDHGQMKLAWHNDLLLSHWQSISLSTSGAVWSGGSLPDMNLYGGALQLQIPMGDGSARLHLTAGDYYDGWKVTEISLYARQGDVWHSLLRLPEDCLSDDICLPRCHPGEWNASDAASW